MKKSRNIWYVWLVLFLSLFLSVFTYSVYSVGNAITKINATDFEKTLLIILYIGIMVGAFRRK